MQFDSDLKWKEHDGYIYNELIKYTSIFHRLRNNLLSSILHNIYCAFVLPHILYGIEGYANTSASYFKSLNID